MCVCVCVRVSVCIHIIKTDINLYDKNKDPNILQKSLTVFDSDSIHIMLITTSEATSLNFFMMGP